nr:DUF349 domain-containing protein [Fodinicola feengrottensis]
MVDGETPQSQFGRIDADGTVYVRTAAGERTVGSWQAGSAEEGLAHFSRRYDDLVTEVVLIENRLASGSTDASHVAGSVKRLTDSLPTAAAVGDLDKLAARLEVLSGKVAEGAEKAKAERAAQREAAVVAKTALVAEAELIAAESTQWKTAGDRLRAILDEWKAIRGADRKSDGDLWKRYAAARDAFGRRRGSHFASLDAARRESQTAKEKLVAEAEELATSSEWGPAATRLKQLMGDWKGTAPRAARGRGHSLDPFPGRPGRLLRPPQRGLQRAGRRTAQQPEGQGGTARRGREPAHRHGRTNGAGQDAGHPVPLGVRRPGPPRLDG